ncbi:MAG: NDP-sugar synthase [Planctomycetes bacterium]|nr:NDP-sugar synthase [Planctomycetota bacterium]
MRALVLAGGRGSRLGEVTEHLPKCLLRVGGMPILDRTLRWLATQGVREVAIHVEHLADLVERHVGTGGPFGLQVRWVRTPMPCGSAGAVRAAAEFLGAGPMLVVHGDRVHEWELARLLRDHERNEVVGTLAVFSAEKDPESGVAGARAEVDRSGRILRITERTDEPRLPWLLAGAYALDPVLLQHIPGDQPFQLVKDLFQKVLRLHGVLCAHEILGRVVGVDTPQAHAQARRKYEEGVTG